MVSLICLPIFVMDLQPAGCMAAPIDDRPVSANRSGRFQQADQV